MADEGNVISNLDLSPEGNGEDTLPAAGVISQYVKDLSVENPNAPDCFQWQDPPQVDVQFNIGAKPINVVASANSLGRNRCTAPRTTAARSSASVSCSSPPANSTASRR